jgi:hypothetical protein
MIRYYQDIHCQTNVREEGVQKQHYDKEIVQISGLRRPRPRRRRFPRSRVINLVVFYVSYRKCRAFKYFFRGRNLIEIKKLKCL